MLESSVTDAVCSEHDTVPSDGELPRDDLVSTEEIKEYQMNIGTSKVVISVVSVYLYIQWNLSNMDTTWTKIIVLISEVSEENNVCSYEVGTRSSVLINQVYLFQRCPVSGVPLYLITMG